MNRKREKKAEEAIENWNDRKQVIKEPLEYLNELVSVSEFTEKQSSTLAEKIQRINLWIKKLGES